MARRLTRRSFLAGLGAVAALPILAACQPQVVEKMVKETVVVEKVVTKEVVKEVPKEVIKEVTKIVEKEKVVEKVVTVIQPAAVLKPSPAAQKITVWLGGFNPTEWTTRSAENPIVVNASRILTQRFEKDHPGIKIDLPTLTWKDQDTREAWLAAHVASADAPELWNTGHPEAIRKGWTVALNDYLSQPNPYDPKYKTWQDSFFPAVMASMTWPGNKIYAVPLGIPYPQTEIGLVVNLDVLKAAKLEAPQTWGQQLAVGTALKKSGTGISPWPDQGGFDMWPMFLQLMPAILQPLGPKYDTTGNRALDVDEALAAFRSGLIGPKTEPFQIGWRQYRKLADEAYVKDWTSTDLQEVWRQGKAAFRYANPPLAARLIHDVTLKFPRTYITQPYIVANDFTGATDPDNWTKGDGKLPADLMVSIVGGGQSILESSTKKNGTFDASLKFLQFISATEQVEFIVNENEYSPTGSVDAKLGPIWQNVANQKMPLRKYGFTWPGMGVWFDITQHIEMRRVFQGWITNQFNDAEFWSRMHQTTDEAATRYEEAKKKLEKK